MASRYHKKIQAVLKEADLSKKRSEDLRKELESYFYEKEMDLRFNGMKTKDIQISIQKDFGDEKLIGSTFQLVHKFSVHSFLKLYMKKIIIGLSILIGAFLFWAPWMANDGGEEVIRKLQTKPEVQSLGRELASKYSLANGYACDGIWSTWAPFGRMVRVCGASWYITFFGANFYREQAESEIPKTTE